MKKVSSNPLINFVTHYRGIFVTLFILPASFLLHIYVKIRQFYYRLTDSHNHKKKIENIQNQIKAWDGKYKMCTGRPGWQAVSMKVGKYKKTHYKIYTNKLRSIVELNEKKQTIIVEPGISMGEITYYLKNKGWTLAVIPELDALTVGGLVNGFGIESTSHKYGLFQHICKSFEIITPDGNLHYCSKEKNPDLFYAIPWSYGSLGFLVTIEISIIPAKPYIQLDYEPFYHGEKMLKAFEKASRNTSENGYDFVELLMYSRNSGVLMKGNFTNKIHGIKKSTVSKFWTPWFYKHVEKYLKKNQKGQELIPKRDYYHRHTRSLFWEMQSVIPFGNNFFYRILFGWLGSPDFSLIKLTETPEIHRMYDEHHMDQDFLVPVTKLDKVLDYIEEKICFYPLWICPCRIPESPNKNSMVEPLIKNDDLYVDVGIYGEPTVLPYNAKKVLREIEAFLRENQSYQALYADTFQTKEELRKMFNHTLLDKMRKKYKCEDALLEIYDKVSRKARE